MRATTAAVLCATVLMAGRVTAQTHEVCIEEPGSPRSCGQVPDDSEPSSSGGTADAGRGNSAQPDAQRQLLNAGVAAGAKALGEAIHDSLYGSPEVNARRERDLEQSEIEQQLREREQERQAERKKRDLLGTSGSADPGSLHMMGVAPDAPLDFMTDNVPTGTARHSHAYQLGHDDAIGCISQNAGPRCAGEPAEQSEACVADYRAGYSVGSREQERSLREAFHLGGRAAAAGQANSAASDPRADGPCRIEWVEAYTRGYSARAARARR